MMKSADLYEGLENMSVKGGSDIGVVAAMALFEYIKETDLNGKDALVKIDAYADRIKNLKPSMGSVHNIINVITDKIRDGALKDPNGLDSLEKIVSDFREETETALQKLAENFSNTVNDGDVILTHSYTKSALMSLESAAVSGVKFSVICNESRPLREGAFFAKELARRSIPAKVITDASVAFYLPEATKVVVGADAIYSDGTVVNKMGTLTVAMLAREFKIPVYVLSISTKLYLPSTFGHRLELEHRPISEIMERLEGKYAQYLSIENIFFEEVPPDYITYLVTEKGVLKPCQLLERAER